MRASGRFRLIESVSGRDLKKCDLRKDCETGSIAGGDKMGKEADLAKVVVSWLNEQHWDVYQEVQIHGFGGVADIVAVQGPLVWVIECKTSLSLTVMEQASVWRVHFRSVAVPTGVRHHSRTAAYRVARLFFKVGVLCVSSHNVTR